MNDTNWLVLAGIVVVGVAALFLFDGGTEPTGPVLPPIVDAGPDRVLSECSSVRVGCEGFDPAGGAVSYQWTAPRGSFDNARVLHPLYTAPTTCGFGEVVILTFTVTNEHGVNARDNLVVHVRDTIPCAYSAICPASSPCMVPVIPASRPAVHRPYILPQPTPLCAPVPLVHPPVLAPCAPTPPVRSCPIPCPVPCSTCPQPLVPTCPIVCPTPCPVPWSTCPTPPAPTCPTVCPTPCPTESVVEGDSIQLRGAVWDPDCNLASYYWTTDKGRFDDPSSLNPVYYAPMTANPYGEDACITLTAIDSCGARTASRIALHIRNANRPPVVDAGRDLVAVRCSSIQLAGSASDPDGDRLTYHWSAECGRGQFSNTGTLCPVYTTPPAVACGGEYIVLTLTVTDEQGARTRDSMTVLVRN